MSSKTVKVKEVQSAKDEQTAETKAPAAKPKPQRVRSRKYVATKSKVDKTRHYDVLSAMELVKQLSYTKFDGTITAELQVKDLETSANVTLPNDTGRQRKVVVVDDAVLKDIEAGKFEFDILISSPEYMPKLAKHAKELGPRGLMPNPKNGTLTANPKKAAEELSAGKRLLRTEKKQPLMHVTIGKVSMDSKKLIENLQALAKALKGKIDKVSLSATMGPGVKVDLETI